MNFSSHSFKDTNLHSKIVYDLKWNCDGSFLGSISADKTLKISQLDNTGVAKSYQTVATTVVAAQVCWHPTDVNRFAFCSDEKYVEVWDVRSQRPTGKLKGPGQHIYNMWSPDGNYFAVGNKQDVLVVFDIRNPTESTQIAKHKFNYEVNEFAWSANSDYILIATGGEGVGSVELMGFNGTDLNSIQSFPAHSSNCTNLKLDATFTRMAVGACDHLVSLWDVDDLICQRTVNMESEVKATSFSGDGSYLAAIGEEYAVVIIDSDSGECIAKAQTRQRLSALSWHPKLNMIAIAADDRSPVPSYIKLISFFK